MNEIKVTFVIEDSGNCRQVFKDTKSGKYYIRMIDGSWYTSTKTTEPSSPLAPDVVVKIVKGSKVYFTDPTIKELPFMETVANQELSKYAKKLKCKDYDTYKKIMEADKSKCRYKDYTANWINAESDKKSEKKIASIEYVGTKLDVVQVNYQHKISNRKWSEVSVRIHGTDDWIVTPVYKI